MYPQVVRQLGVERSEKQVPPPDKDRIALVPADRDGPGEPAGEPVAGGRNMDHFCLRIARSHWPSVLEHLRAHGVEVDEPARRYGAEGDGESVYLRDPEGNTVELKAPLPG